MMNQVDLQQKLPKVELHAHLNGSIPLPVLQDLAKERSVQLSRKFLDSVAQQSDSDNPTKRRRAPRSLQDCFDLFAELPVIVNDLPALRRITCAALELFAHHHVAYLELRSTPKRLLYDFRNPKAGFASKLEYVETVVNELKVFSETEESRFLECKEKRRLPMVSRLIVAVDRSLPFDEGKENVELAIQLFSDPFVVGVDLGGNPTKQSFRLFEPLFVKARNHGLKVTLHCAEVPDCEQEVKDMLAFKPDRLGHAVLLPDPTMLDSLRIPVESCPTSNVMTLELFGHHADNDEHDTVSALRSQHKMLRHWLNTKYPIAICTDDAGIFETHPTHELWVVQEAFSCDVLEISLQSIDYAFCDDTTKDKVRNRMKHAIRHLQES